MRRHKNHTHTFTTWLAMLALSIAALTTVGCQEKRPVFHDGPQFKVMTYNLYWNHPDPERGEKMIRALNPDLLVLQEVTSEWEGTLERLKPTYPASYCRLNEQGQGNAILSRWPISKVGYKPSVSGWHGGWQVRVHTPLGPVQVVAVHLTPPLDRHQNFSLAALLETGPVHLQEIQYLMDGIAADLPVIVLGDFNEDINGAAGSWLIQKGLKDALTPFDPLTPSWKLPEAQWINARVDHVFHSDDLNCIKAMIVPDHFSDHEPVLAIFQKKDSQYPRLAVDGSLYKSSASPASERLADLRPAASGLPDRITGRHY